MYDEKDSNKGGIHHANFGDRPFRRHLCDCEDKDQKFFAIETNELPAGATEGTVLEIDDEGVIHVNEEKTAARRSKIKKLQDKLWKE